MLPTYFISHGGGPWPWLRDEMPRVHDLLEASLADIPRQLDVTPEAILMVSGHWEAAEFTVMSSPAPGMVYDYSGFPPHTYQIKYPAAGSPEVASRVQTLLQNAGFKASADPTRGFDHGTFAPMAAIYPNANVPLLQLSLRRDYDVDAHLAAGRALAPLRKEGILIIGSGLSYHNLRQFGPSGAHPSREFDSWLTPTLYREIGEARENKLRQWTSAPSALIAHPNPDHFIPLIVAVGAAEQERGERIYHEDAFFGALSVSSYRFGKSRNA